MNLLKIVKNEQKNQHSAVKIAVFECAIGIVNKKIQDSGMLLFLLLHGEERTRKL
jgi:hypothetical protein